MLLFTVAHTLWCRRHHRLSWSEKREERGCLMCFSQKSQLHEGHLSHLMGMFKSGGLVFLYLDLFIIQEKYWNGTICLSLKLKPEPGSVQVQVQDIVIIPEGQFVAQPTVTTAITVRENTTDIRQHVGTCRPLGQL